MLSLSFRVFIPGRATSQYTQSHFSLHTLILSHKQLAEFILLASDTVAVVTGKQVTVRISGWSCPPLPFFYAIIIFSHSRRVFHPHSRSVNPSVVSLLTHVVSAMITTSVHKHSHMSSAILLFNMAALVAAHSLAHIDFASLSLSIFTLLVTSLSISPCAQRFLLTIIREPNFRCRTRPLTRACS